MNKFKEIKPEELNKSPFKLIGRDWMLITAEKKGRVNTMTASWGGLGVMWGKNVAYAVIRPARYTKEFVDYSDRFSLTFFDDSYKKQLQYLGSVSGRNENKVEKSELTVGKYKGVPYFEEGNLVVICKKLYKQELRPECFIEKELDQKWYNEKDYHTMYISEIEKIFIK